SEATDESLRVFRRTRVNDRIDDRNSNSAAEIAHEVEQTTGIGDSSLCQLSEGKLRGRQNAKHDGATTHHLRPKHFIEVCGSRLKGTQTQPYSEEKEAERGQ